MRYAMGLWAMLAGALLSGCSGSSAADTGDLELSSTTFSDGGTLPDAYVCTEVSGLDASTNPPLSWTGAPTGTEEFALLMSTFATDASGTTVKYNWVLYDIPASASSIPEHNTTITSGDTGTTVVGTPGLTSDGPYYDYSPPCSSGPGLKQYTFTLYALSQAPEFTPNTTPGTGGDGSSLEAAIDGITLARASISVSYTFA